jgi:hypothetical protein
MAYKRRFVSSGEKSKLRVILRVLGWSLFAVVFITAGSIGCKKKTAAQEPAQTEQVAGVKEGLNDFAGVVKVGFKKYLYIPAFQGFDIVAPGQVDSGDASTLVGKEVRGKGEFSPQRPSLLIANSIDLKEPEGGWRNVFTRSEEVVLDDYLDLKRREEFQVLDGLAYDKKESWEGKEKGKVFGKLLKGMVTEEGQQKEVYQIVVLDKKNNQVGVIVVDSFSDFARYYLTKLGIFENFWFYVTVKETVDWKTRQAADQLFHADVLYCGLF